MPIASLAMVLLVTAPAKSKPHAYERYVDSSGFLDICYDDLGIYPLTHRKREPGKNSELDREACLLQVSKWAPAIWKSLELLPESYFQRIQQRYSRGRHRPLADKETLEFWFYRHDDSNRTRIAQTIVNQVQIFILEANAKSNANFTLPQSMFYILHELGHVRIWSDDFSRQVAGEASPQLRVPIINDDEDAAESFALYIMAPDYLKELHPKRYRYMRRVLGQEYQQDYLSLGFLNLDPSREARVFFPGKANGK